MFYFCFIISTFISFYFGNIRTLELVAQFELFLVIHIKECRIKGRGHIVYLFPTKCEEIITLMSEKV